MTQVECTGFHLWKLKPDGRFDHYQKNSTGAFTVPAKPKGWIMNKATGMALLAVGIALIIYGLNASDSVSSEISRAFTGSPTNKTMWLLLGGIVSTIVGAAMMFQRSGKT